MSTSTPTLREICLVTILLVVLHTLSNAYDFSFQQTALSVTTDTDSFQGSATAIGSYDQGLSPQNWRTRLTWRGLKVPQTQIIAHVPGWTIFDRLYTANGTIFLVSDEPDKLPDRSVMTSRGMRVEDGPVDEARRIPTDEDMRIIGTKVAKDLFGESADVVDGVTWFVNDPPQFVTHYYHWCAELFFGFWRTYSSLDPFITPDGGTTLPPPRRMLYPHLDADHWRDYASMNQLFLRSSFPSITSEFEDDWIDRAKTGRPYVFDRVVFADRSAAMNGYNFRRTQRTASEPFTLPGSVNWWSTIRKNVIEFTGLKGDIGRGTKNTPVITYISRQGWGRRMLIQADHDKLVDELYKLRDVHGYEVNVVSMDKLSRMEQLKLAARTTIMMGVHGNGLTSLIWMKPSPRSTVIEFFFPGGFAHDYEYTTRALGMVHYGFWGSSSFTSPDTPQNAYPDGFQGNEIPIDGSAVARLCYDRLTLSDEADD